MPVKFYNTLRVCSYTILGSLLVWVCSTKLSGQNTLFDSVLLENELAKGEAYITQHKGDSALFCYRQVLKLNQEIQTPLLGAKALLGIATSYFENFSQFDSTLIYAQKAKKQFLYLNQKRLLAETLVLMGEAALKRAHSKEALTYLREAEKTHEEIGLDSLNSLVYYKMSNIYIWDNQIGPYESMLNKARAVGERYNRKSDLALIYMSLSAVHENRKDYDSTLIYSQKALEISKVIKNPELTGYAYLNMGLAEYNLGNYSSAKRYHQQMIEMTNVPRVVYANYIYYYGRFLGNIGEYERAEFYLKKALNICWKSGDRSLKMFVVQGLYLLYAKSNQFQKALFYINKFKILNEQQRSAEIQKEIATIDARYEAEKKEREILTLRSKTLEQELFLINTKTLTQQRFWWSLIVSLTLLLLGIAFWIYYRYSQHKQKITIRETAIQKNRLKQLKQGQKKVAMQAMLLGEEEERKRVAKELHDGLGILLSTLKLGLSQSADRPSPQQTIKLVDRANEELRRIAQNMMPEGLFRFGLIAALEDLCDEINYSQSLQVNFQQFGLGEELDSNVSHQLYRIIQELLSNVIKHADATEIILELIQRDEILYITIEDNGKGFDFEKAQKNASTRGLRNVQSRVNYLNGELTWNTSPGQGTTISLALPLIHQNHDQIIRH